MKTPVIQPVENDPFQEDIQSFWSTYAKDLVRKSIETIDGTAKHIIAVAGILEGLYFHAIAYCNLHGQVLSGEALFIYVLPLILFCSVSSAHCLFFTRNGITWIFAHHGLPN